MTSGDMFACAKDLIADSRGKPTDVEKSMLARAHAYITLGSALVQRETAERQFQWQRDVDSARLMRGE